MTDPLDDLFSDPSGQPGSGQSQGGALRKQLEQVLEQNRLLTERLTRAEQAERDRALAGLFDKHKIPELARDFFPKDAELTDDVAKGFVDKYGALWGHQPPAATTPPEQQAQTSAIQQFAQTAPPADSSFSEQEYVAKMGEAGTRDEVLRLLAQYGGQVTETT